MIITLIWTIWLTIFITWLVRKKPFRRKKRMVVRDTMLDQDIG